MLDISLELLLICTSVVLITLSFLNFLLYQPLMGRIKIRNRDIEKCYAYAKTHNENIHKIKEEIDSILLKAKEESNDIKTKAIKEARLSIAQFKKDLKINLDKDYEIYCSSLQSGKKAFVQNLQKHSSEINDNLQKKLLA
jgi:F0F1-type ATP synthase membrane subunit b/b'